MFSRLICIRSDMSNDGTIDWARVRDLRDEVGAEDFEEVIDLFMSEVQECLGSVDQNAAASKMEEDMHFLKGSALNLGFASFADYCQVGEKAAAAGSPQEVDVTMVRALFAQSHKTFSDGLKTEL